jgi:hypothetical protein
MFLNVSSYCSDAKGSFGRSPQSKSFVFDYDKITYINNENIYFEIGCRLKSIILRPNKNNPWAQINHL